MKEILKNKIEEVIKALNIEDVDFTIEHPADINHGEWTTNIAMVAANKKGINPKEMAEEIVNGIGEVEGVETIEIAGPGFINFKLTHGGIIKSLDIKSEELCKGEKVLVEYTDPNPFKQFHIGHLMSNAIGEVVARLYESQGADVTRIIYGGDIGLHVAKAMWGKKDLKNGSSIKDWGDAYTHGANMYEDDESVKGAIDGLNKVIYEFVVNGGDFIDSELYKEGKEISQEHFEEIYEILGSKFDKHYFESDVVKKGLELVNANEIFVESDGAIVFKGEEHDPSLHTRVFINSVGVPTYETKELGLAYRKDDDFEYDKSIVVTASEQSGYFKVVSKALEILNKKISDKTQHISHGMMRFADGKMSSRKGNIITGESLVMDLIKEVEKKMEDRDVKDKEVISKQIAMAALKFSILKQTPGKNIVFNPEEALSLEGDSGPYIQYAYTRAMRVIEKSELKPSFNETVEVTDLERVLLKANDVFNRSYEELAPQYIITYLLTLAHTFNGFYQSTQIIGSENEEHYIAITEKFSGSIKYGLNILGIEASEEM